MTQYEYKILYGPTAGYLLMPWASQEVRQRIGPGGLERQLNQLAEDRWEPISCSTAPAGSLFWQQPYATIVLRRSVTDAEQSPSGAREHDGD